MKTYNLFVIAAIALLSASCSTLKKASAPLAALVPANPLVSEVDSMSYALGVNMGSSFANDLKNIPGGKSNTDLIIKGFSQAIKGDSTLLNGEEAQTYFRNYITKAQQIENEAKRAAGEKFLAENKLREGVQTTPSGLQYMVLQSSNGAKPAATDRVKVHYTGTTTDGNVFDSSVQRGEPTTFVLNQVIKGWTEGVQLMPVGSKYKFFIPSELAYGEQGVPQAGIPPHAPLVFEVELLGIEQPEVATPPVITDAKPAPAPKKPATKKRRKK